MLRLLVATYLGGWLASAAPFYSTAKAANPNEPIRNALRAFGLSAVWIVSLAVGVVLVQDLITRFKPTPKTASGATGPTVS